MSELYTCKGCGPNKTEAEMYKRGKVILAWCKACMVEKQQAGRKKKKGKKTKTIKIAKKVQIAARSMSLHKPNLEHVNNALQSANKVHDDVYYVAEEFITLFEAQNEKPECVQFVYNPDGTLSKVDVMTKRRQVFG